MTITRRSILKSMMAGGALAGLGLPKLTLGADTEREAHPVVLVSLGNVPRFAQGAGRAGAYGEYILGRHIPELSKVQTLFATQRGKRLVGLMNDGAYALFAELARDAGARQWVEGRHTEQGEQTRHALQSVAGFHGAAEPLAAALATPDNSFAITEVPLGAADTLGMRTGDWTTYGFTSYRVNTVPTPGNIWLHLAGVDLAQGCEALDVDPQQAELLRCWRSYAPSVTEGGAGWQAALGQTLAGLAARGAQNHVPCISQAFIHRCQLTGEGAAHHSYVSFVMEA